MHSDLIDSGYVLHEGSNVWMRDGYDSIQYSDGDDFENGLARVLLNVSDLSVLSDELRRYCVDWPSTYHLSAQRANLLRPLADTLNGSILEIGAGCGAITRFLGELGADVLALEGTARRAEIARLRTHDLDNVTVLAERFGDFQTSKKFDVITLIGVLEYANLFTPGDQPHIEMLRQARKLLKPNGRLIIAIENQLGLKYFSGAPEDHLGTVMYGVEDRYRANEPQTFGRAALENAIRSAGWASTEFLAPFPDYKLPRSIVSQRGFEDETFDGAALASQSVAYDPQMPPATAFSLDLAWPVLSRNGLARDMANSFLVVAHDGNFSFSDERTLAWHYSTNRVKRFCKQSEFVRGEEGKLWVNTRLLSSSSGSDARSDTPLTLTVSDIAPYASGKTLGQELASLLAQDNWSSADIAKGFFKYIIAVEQIVSRETGASLSIESEKTEVGSAYFDLNPNNIVLKIDGTFEKIDQEWSFDRPVTSGYLVFRSVINILSAVERLGGSPDLQGITPYSFMKLVFDRLGWTLAEANLRDYVSAETSIRRQVFGIDAHERDLSTWLHTWVPGRPSIFALAATRAQELSALVEERSALQIQIAELTKSVDVATARLVQSEKARAELSDLGTCLGAANAELIAVRTANSDLHGEVERLRDYNRALLNSTSWRFSSPVRFLGHQMWRIRRMMDVAPLISNRLGGPSNVARRAASLLKQEGLTGIRSRLRHVVMEVDSQTTAPGIAIEAPRETVPAPALVIPWYIDPAQGDTTSDIATDGPRICVILRIRATDELDILVERLRHIPREFSLYVVTEADDRALHKDVQDKLPKAIRVSTQTADHGQNTQAIVRELLRSELSGYDIVGLFYDLDGGKRKQGANAGSNPELDCLLGDASAIRQIIARLAEDADAVFAVEDAEALRKRVERPADVAYDLGSEGLPAPAADAAEHLAMWARADRLSAILETLGDVLPRGEWTGLRVLNVTRGDSIKDYRQHEEQVDYRQSILYQDIKVLAYYLPQFHTTPENDEWHGKGFTEWTKVRAANPLYEGHYQQHIPHNDMGYYILDNPTVLHQQADMMHAAGIHGMIFYHYWFGGRMILEEPAQMLLENVDIDMPFCFCWANENWTRRWDGNEKEILLGQRYSPDDARAFIRYLIPFFKDHRYIRVAGRPALYVYRPSDLPTDVRYVDIWKEECEQAGLPSPYLVSVLTRGALDPREFGMDAGVERVLHDWTGGAVAERKNNLRPYTQINGTVLDYGDVASFYSSQADPKEFTYFRSLVPIWDNTARYGNGGYVIDASTPQLFQGWLEAAIAYSRDNLPADRRFVIVNAWNEWAEGAHLEPDTRYGYAYLNAVGRALSIQAYEQQAARSIVSTQPVALTIMCTSAFQSALRDNPTLARRFEHVLSRVKDLPHVAVHLHDASRDLFPTWADTSAMSEGIELELEISRPSVFAPDAISKMVQAALAHPDASIVCNEYHGDPSVIDVEPNNALRTEDALRQPMVLRRSAGSPIPRAKFCMATQAWCFPLSADGLPAEDLPKVTTVVRVHTKSDLQLLRRALSCLCVMRNCLSIPMIAAQDFLPSQVDQLDEIIAGLPWREGCTPIVNQYFSEDSKGDLRSKMLNESLKSIRDGYAGILDYDDLLFSNAYSWLIDRLTTTGKAVSFGRVYSSLYLNQRSLIIARQKIYTSRVDYAGFVNNNHAPNHSFLMDMSRIDMTSTIYYPDQKYMEDYFLLLQVFGDSNTDWDSLSADYYVGDYIHSIDRVQTLALTDEDTRAALIETYDYRRDELRVSFMQRQLLKQISIERDGAGLEA
ncbi:glycoside hydrolase family 99-like domain-containing protein [Aureimonas altamirensis]|uniref:glycoside hydrolase family 99-like domain-containing protein n=1 Tax=Aureimonas altamirensis TaxID=370622 RepID=UPI001E4DA151|nr:glycoside hydrolase family 99-like domain-containing protein [Aureimonas altamirensis]UHD45082.1 glycoside hydrolase family 99-like domain-containing protein [Aureimonas altamirensis]